MTERKQTQHEITLRRIQIDSYCWHKYQEGVSVREIAERLGRGRMRVYGRIKRYEREMRRINRKLISLAAGIAE